MVNKTKINKSIVADDGSSITNASIINSKKKFHPQSATIGFIIGIASSIAANYIWEWIK